MLQSNRTERLITLRNKIERYSVLEERDRCENSLKHFVEAAWPYIDSSQFQNSWALDALSDHLENVCFGNIRRLLINIPPRCAKTTICSIVYPAWVWARSQTSFWSGPQVKFLCASYSHQLSLDSSNKSRRLFYSPWFQKLWPNEIVLQLDQNTKGNFENTKGGARIATSVGGGLLGLGFDTGITDDLNNTERNKIETDAERTSAATFWNEFHSTRMNDPKRSAIINIQQRVHQEDVSGLILDSGEDWTHLMIPMRHDEKRHCITVKLPQYDDDEPWEDPRTDNELMWPERFGEKEVVALEKALGPYLASGRLQQEPTPKGGGILKREWWLPWDATEAQKYGLEWHGGIKEFPTFELICGSLDTAFKEKEENDFNALTIWGIWLDRNRNRRAMLMFAWAKRLPLHGKVISAHPGEAKVTFEQRLKESWGLVEWIADTCKRYKVTRLLIEDKSRGHDVANELKRLYARDNWGIQLINPVGDKVSRAHSVVSLFTDDAIYAPDTKWADLVISECLIAGTRIITDRGIFPIEEICVGDRVLTHKGRFRPVVRTFSKKATELYKIEGKTLDPLTITPEHPFYSIKFNAVRGINEPLSWVKAKDMQASLYKPVVRNGKTYMEAYPSPRNAVILPVIIRENPINDLDLREWVNLSPGKKHKLLVDTEVITTSHHASQEMKWKQVLDKPFGRFLGLFLAEGYARRQVVCWAFNKKEISYINEISDFIRNRFGCRAWINHLETSTTVNTCLPLLESFFYEFGTFSHNKKIPSWVWDAPDEFIQGLIDGWNDGDGYYNEMQGSKYVSGTTVSLSLAWGIKLLYVRLGKKAHVSLASRAGVMVNSDNGKEYPTRESYSVIHIFNPRNLGSEKIIDGELATYPVMRSTKIEQEQDVFNFEVFEDNSYCTTGGLVHNCAVFPKGAHDDLVDSVTQFLQFAREQELLVRADEMSASMQDAMQYRQPQNTVAQMYGV